jgi:uncharacterized protein (TIGR02452 family)
MATVIDGETIKFDPLIWLEKFNRASKKKEGIHELRTGIFEQTLSIVVSGGYNLENKHVEISNNAIVSEYFDAPDKLDNTDKNSETNISVIDADCLEIAHIMTKARFNPCVLNMANRQNPGGGVKNGAGAQEENLFRRSNLFISLYQFAPYAKEYGLEQHEKQYPLNRSTGGIYSGNVTVFRGSEKNGYCLLKEPFQTSVVTVPAINRPDLVFENNEIRITNTLIEPTREKIRTILRIAGKYKHDCLVLGAFGCGAFQNPPKHMARLFHDVFAENEFKKRFVLIVFAILEDHSNRKEHNPQGNIFPFMSVFDGNNNAV